MIPLSVPGDAEIEAARHTLHEWGTTHGYEDISPDDLLVMFFRSTVEREGWQLRLRWRPGDGFYSGRWSFRGEVGEHVFCGRSLDEARLIGCAALILAKVPSSEETGLENRMTQPPSVPDAKSSRTD